MTESDRIYCFEPSKTTYDVLLNNVKNYKSVQAFNFGFGERDETCVLYSDCERSAQIPQFFK